MGPRLEDVQKQKLLDLVEQNYHILFGRRVANGNKKRNEKWTEISEVLNSLGTHCKKNAAGWKQCYADLKYKVKNKLVKIRAEKVSRNKTGGGPISDDDEVELDPDDVRITDMCGIVALDGLQDGQQELGLYDDDERDSHTNVSVINVDESMVDDSPPSPSFSILTALRSSAEDGLLNYQSSSPGPSNKRPVARELSQVNKKRRTDVSFVDNDNEDSDDDDADQYPIHRLERYLQETQQYSASLNQPSLSTSISRQHVPTPALNSQQTSSSVSSPFTQHPSVPRLNSSSTTTTSISRHHAPTPALNSQQTSSSVSSPFTQHPSVPRLNSSSTTTTSISRHHAPTPALNSQQTSSSVSSPFIQHPSVPRLNSTTSISRQHRQNTPMRQRPAARGRQRLLGTIRNVTNNMRVENVSTGSVEASLKLQKEHLVLQRKIYRELKTLRKTLCPNVHVSSSEEEAE